MATKTIKNQLIDRKREAIVLAMDDGATAALIARNNRWSVESVRAIMHKERTERLAASVTLGKRVQILESLFFHLGDSHEVAKDVSRPVDEVEAVMEIHWKMKEPKVPSAKPAKQAMKPKTMALLKQMKAIANEVIAKQLSISVKDADMVRAVLWSRQQRTK